MNKEKQIEIERLRTAVRVMADKVDWGNRKNGEKSCAKCPANGEFCDTHGVSCADILIAWAAEPEEPPSLYSLRGSMPNLTGGLLSEEYVRIQRRCEPQCSVNGVPCVLYALMEEALARIAALEASRE